MYLGPRRELGAVGGRVGVPWAGPAGPGHSRVRALPLGLGQLAAAQDVNLQLLLGGVVAQGELHTALHGHPAQLPLAVQAHQAPTQLRGGDTPSGGLQWCPHPAQPQSRTVEELRLDTEELVLSRLGGARPFCGDSGAGGL